MELNPNQFQVNEAWIVFKLNDAPVITEADGDLDVIALMDTPSCFILGTGFVRADSLELSKLESRRLLKNGWSHNKKYPKRLLIPKAQPADMLIREAKRHRISITRAPEEKLSVFIKEARQGFQEHVSGSRL